MISILFRSIVYIKARFRSDWFCIISLIFSFSKDLISLLLDQSDALSKDSNLFYIAVEIGIQKKGIFDLERLNVTCALTDCLIDYRVTDWLTDLEWLVDWLPD